MMKPKNVIVQSDEEDQAPLHETLEDAKHATSGVATAWGALDRLCDTVYDLVITALESDDSPRGLRVDRAVKWRWSKTSVISAAEKRSFDPVKAAIDLGVDGYLLKPIEASELQGTVQQALDRRKARCCVEEVSHVVIWRGLALDMWNGEITLDE